MVHFRLAMEQRTDVDKNVEDFVLVLRDFVAVRGTGLAPCGELAGVDRPGQVKTEHDLADFSESL